MSSEDLMGESPNSIANLESDKDWLGQEIDSLLSQPADPAILERINREHEVLKELSQKAVTVLSGEEALRLISGQHLTYAEAPQHFARWWNSIDPTTQQEVNATAEDFENLTDYQWRCLTASGGSVLNATKETLGIKSLFAQMQAGMPKIDEEQFTSLWIDAVRRRKILSRGRERSPVKSFRLYRECAGAVRLGSKMRLIAGAFPIRRLVLSR
jgi:hypothetical protein